MNCYTTQGRKSSYVYQVGSDFVGFCTGCGWTVTKVGHAPALMAASDHAQNCWA
ncbi:hypothetical protein [Micromonospora rosaria]|uniref:Spread protein n=1 Tax=Micromonospora rosaria TaxID=47874 RepID=Q58SZ4_9ACTN|nr:hypothetical protein [Micromonospora rosaria]AAX38999.1 spread protein [Micromonospora rosaria]